MANNVFISFRYSDGIAYKNDLAKIFDDYYDTVDYSEDENRFGMSEETIRSYLYKKLRRSSVTIILLTPLAVNHKKNMLNQYDDWMYDEIRYSLENRENNHTNGLIAIYTPEAEDMIIERGKSNTTTVLNVNNLFRRNMMNIKPRYKKNPRPGVFDSNYDSYCSLVEYSTFVNNVGKYVGIAKEKREIIEHYDIIKRM